MGTQEQPNDRPGEPPVLGYAAPPPPPPRPLEDTAVGKVDIWSVTTWLMLINIAVFLTDRYVFHRSLWIGQVVGHTLVPVLGPMGPLEWWGYFSIQKAIFEGQVWRFVTFQFLHADIWHLAFNMMFIYFFGPLVEEYLRPRRFLAFYLISGCFGAVGYMLLWAIRTPLVTTAYAPLIGASAGAFGILIAAAFIAPHETVMIYGLIPMRLRAMAWVMLGIAVWTVYTYGPNAGGEAAHLGGAAAGYVLIKNQQMLDRFESARTRWRRRREGLN